MALAATEDYPLLDVMWSMIVFFGLLLFFWLLFVVFDDLFKRRDIGGWGKTLWTVVVILLPYLGVFTYLIVEGRDIVGRRAQEAAEAQQQLEDRMRRISAQAPAGGTGEIQRGKQLLDEGTITADEFDAIKRRALV
ncbi:PLDc N-terminal domain-containing protein [Modestobacter italicus]|nr:PLDc N-terminal domain-containing protein [Modestobacter marinus]